MSKRRASPERDGRSTAKTRTRAAARWACARWGTRVRASRAFTCPACGETSNLKLPEGWTVAQGEEEAEGGGQGLRAKCGECGETVEIEPPDGQRFSRRKAGEAAAGFARAYGRVPNVREALVRHAHLASAMRVR